MENIGYHLQQKHPSIKQRNFNDPPPYPPPALPKDYRAVSWTKPTFSLKLTGPLTAIDFLRLLGDAVRRESFRVALMVNRITACKDSDKYARYSVGTVRSFEPDAHSVLSFEPDADETAELDTNGVIRLFLHSHDSAESDGEDFDDCDELVNSDDCEALVDRGATDLEELFWEPTKKTWNAEWSDPYA